MVLGLGQRLRSSRSIPDVGVVVGVLVVMVIMTTTIVILIIPTLRTQMIT